MHLPEHPGEVPGIGVAHPPADLPDGQVRPGEQPPRRRHHGGPTIHSCTVRPVRRRTTVVRWPTERFTSRATSRGTLIQRNRRSITVKTSARSGSPVDPQVADHVGGEPRDLHEQQREVGEHRLRGGTSARSASSRANASTRAVHHRTSSAGPTASRSTPDARPRTNGNSSGWVRQASADPAASGPSASAVNETAQPAARHRRAGTSNGPKDLPGCDDEEVARGEPPSRARPRARCRGRHPRTRASGSRGRAPCACRRGPRGRSRQTATRQLAGPTARARTIGGSVSHARSQPDGLHRRIIP